MAKKGHIPWNKGKKFPDLHPQGMLGKKHTAETIEKMSGHAPWNKGQKFPNLHPKGMLGQHHSEETKRKMSIAGKGRKLGSMPEERKRKISETKKRKFLTGELPSPRGMLGVHHSKE